MDSAENRAAKTDDYAGVMSASVVGVFVQMDVAACATEPGALIACPVSLAVIIPGTAAISYLDWQHVKHTREVWKALTKPVPLPYPDCKD